MKIESQQPKVNPTKQTEGIKDAFLTISSGVKRILEQLGRAGVSYEGKRVLVTGGAGFLGSWICDVLVQQEAEVICIDDFASGDPSNIKHLKEESNFTFIKHDISKPITLEKKIDVVMHLASRASPLEFSKFPIQILKANTLGVWVALGIHFIFIRQQPCTPTMRRSLHLFTFG